MKKLHSLFLAALISASAHGQHFVIGAQGGALFNSMPFSSGQIFSSRKSAPEPIAGFKVGWDTKKLSVGLGCNFSKINYDLGLSRSILWNGNFTAPVTNVYAYLQLKKNLVRSYVYYGICAGYIRIGENETKTSGHVHSVSAQKGVTGGVRAGYHFRIAGGLGAYGEAGAVYSTATASFDLYDYFGGSLGRYESDGYIFFPVMAGVDYSF